MNCGNPEVLQAYLDGELPADERGELEGHLSGCLTCRRELAHLKLLWLELGQEREFSLPPEWAYLRQQIVAKSAADRSAKAPDQTGLGFWESQRLAWQDLSLATAYLPGSAEIGNLVKAAGRRLPGLFLDLAGTTLRRLSRRHQTDRKGGPARWSWR